MANDGRTSKPPPFRPRPPARDSEPALVAPKQAMSNSAQRAAVEDDDQADLLAPKAAVGPGGFAAGAEFEQPLPALEPAPEQPLAAAAETTWDLTFDAPTILEHLITDPSHQLLERRAEEMLAELDRASSADEIAMLAYELGELYERWLVDEARAIKSYGRALAAESRFAPNLWAIRRLFYRRGLWANLQKLIDAELAHAERVERRAELLLERGIVCERQGLTADAADAAAAYRACADLAEAPLSALLHLERVALPSMSAQERVALWTELAHECGVPGRRVAYWTDVAHAMLAMADGDGAAPSRANAARDAFDYLGAQVAAADQDADGIARLAVRLAELSGDAGRLAQALGARAKTLQAALASTTGDASGRPTELAAVRRRQAQLAQAQGEHGQAWDYLQQALALAPTELLLLEELSVAAERTGKYAELADVMASWQASESDPGKLLALGLRRVDALIRGGKIDQASELLASLDSSGIAPSGAATIALLREREALLAGDDALAARAQARLGHILASEFNDGQAAAFMWTCAAETLERASEPGDGHEALGWLRQAVAAAPGYMPAILRALELYARTSAYLDGAAFCRAMAETPATGEGHAPAHVRFLRERQCEFLRLAGEEAQARQLLGEIAKASEPGDPVRLAYDVALELAGQADDRLEWLAVLAKSEPAAARRMDACLAAARVCERRGAWRTSLAWCEQAISHAAAAGDASPTYALTLAMARRHELWQDVYRLQRERMPLLDGDEARAAQLECAWVLEFHLGDPERAFREYGHTLLRFPGDAAAVGGAMRTGLASLELLSAAECAQLRELAGRDPILLANWAQAMSNRDAAAAREAFALAADAAPAEGVDPGAPRFAAQRWWMLASDSAERTAAMARLAMLSAPGDAAASLGEAQAWLGLARAPELATFSASIDEAARHAHAPTQRLALGTSKAFIIARQGDADATARAFHDASRAAEVEPGVWAASTHVRAALAVVEDSLSKSQARLDHARRAAPHRADIQVLAADLMGVSVSAAAPTDAPSAATIDHLMSRADLLEQRMALAADSASQHAWRLDRAEALESAGRVADAMAEVQAVLRDRRSDIRALEAMRRLGLMTGRRDLQAAAAFELATFLRQPAARAALWRQAAALWDTEGADDTSLSKATLAYKRLIIDDPDAAEFARLTELLREFGEYDELVDALSQGISHLRHRMNQLAQVGEAAADREAGLIAAPLADTLCERARYYWHLGDNARALADLRQALALAPTHAEAQLAYDVANARQTQHVAAMARHAAEVSGVHELASVRGTPRVTGPAKTLVDRMDEARAQLASHPHRMALYEELLALSRLGGDLLLASRCESVLRCLSSKADPAPPLPARFPPLIALVHDVDVPAVASPLTNIWQALAPTFLQAGDAERRERYNKAAGPEVSMKQLAQQWPVLASAVAATQRSVRVFVTRDHPGVCRVVDGAPIHLYVSEDVARCVRSSDIARCAGALALSAAQLGSAVTSVPADVAGWIEAAAITMAVPAATRHAWLDVHGVASAVDARVTQLSSSISEAQTALLDAAFAKLATLPGDEQMQLSQWQGGLAEVALRIALVTTGDLAGVLEGFDITAATLQEDPVARRLLPWFVSAQFSELWKQRHMETSL
ncbi:MAG: hypothetical protein IPL79_06010 [Myxococcales bacterium]|nr:hypothetical protein [Myxococcales bacterium]